MFKTLAFAAAIGVSALFAGSAGATPLSLAKQLGIESEMTTQVRDGCGRGERWSHSRRRCVRTAESRAMCPRGMVWSNRRARCMPRR